LGLSHQNNPTRGDIEMHQSNDHDHSHEHGHEHGHKHNSDGCEVNKIPMSHDHNHHNMFNELMGAQNTRELVSIYAMEIAIAVHSIIIGANIGLLSSEDTEVTLISLIVAISFHQFMEGFALGTNLVAVLGPQYTLFDRTWNKDKFRLLCFVSIFALTVPLGIVIGIFTSSVSDNEASTFARGVASCLACGSLLYISLVEMVGVYFESSDLSKRPQLKLSMLLSLCIGVLFMAILAIWA
jgi:zinc transporter 1/2/3